MRRLTALSLIALALLSTAIPAQKAATPQAPEPEVSRFSLPLIYSRIRADFPDGTVMTQWRALIGLWSGVQVEAPNGQGAMQRMIIPFFMQRRDDSTGESAWATPFPIPLVQIARSDFGYANYIFPLIWSDGIDRESGLPQRVRAVLPLWWRQVRAPETDQQHQQWAMRHQMSQEQQQMPWAPMVDRWVALNVFHSMEHAPTPDGKTTERDRWGVFPLTWGWIDGEASHLNFHPLMLWEFGRRFHLFPFYWRSEDYHVLAPLAGWIRGGAPVEGSDERSMHRFLLFPLYLQSETPRPEGIHTLRHLLWPLFARGEGGGRSEWRALPLVRATRDVQGEREKEGLQALFPLIWRGRTHEAEALTARHDVFFPLIWFLGWQSDPPEGSGEEVGPWQDVEIVFPFWIRHMVGDTTRTLWAPFPLYSRLDRQGVISERLGLLLAGRTRFPSGATLHDLGTILFRRAEDADHVDTSTLLLLLRTDRNWTEDTARVAVLWRLLEYTREGDDRGLRLLYLPWRIPLP